MGDQRWNRWERGRKGERLFLPFYFFTLLPFTLIHGGKVHLL